VGGKGYIVGGSSAAVTIGYNDLWEYDPSLDVWTQKQSFSGGISDCGVAFSIGSKGYYGTGRGVYGGMYNTIMEYNPQTDAWSYIPPLPGVPRMGALSFVLNGKAYVGYGSNNSGVQQTDFYEFDPSTNNWTLKSVGNFTVRATGAFTLGNQAYIVTGAINSNQGTNDVWSYDPVSNSWTQQNSAPFSSRLGAYGFSILNKGYVAFGDTSNWGLSRDVYELSPDYIIVTGKYSESINDILEVYPNPSNAGFNISTSSKESVIISIKDMLGNCLEKKVIDSEIFLDMNGYPKGVYFMEVLSSTGTIKRKLILE
jgi:N-acetylneuraminic acid mutarotase